MRSTRPAARRRCFSFLAALAALLLGRCAWAAPGDLETSFGGTGKVVVPIGAGADSAAALVVQSDGRILAAGSSSNGTNLDFALVRTTSAGALDAAFGNGTGRVTTPIGTGDDAAQALAVQTDGKIVAAGYASNGANRDVALARYNANGTLDTTFGGGTGIVVTPIGTSDEAALGVALQADGKIVAAGYVVFAPKAYLLVARYNADGSLDTSFGGTGVRWEAMGTGDDVAAAVRIQSDGKIVAAGTSIGVAGADIALMRFNTDGTLDLGFGLGTGFVTTPVGSADDIGSALAIQPDGKLLVGGSSFNGTDDDIALVRYLTDGSLDTSFAGTGVATVPVGVADDVALGIALQGDGRIVTAGYTLSGASKEMALVRVNGDGSLDTSFGGAGSVTTSFGSGDASAAAIAIQSDGRIVVAGQAAGATVDVALARYIHNGSGELDASFDIDGKQTTLVGTDSVANGVAIQADQSIVVAGSASNGTDRDVALARYSSSGQLDLTFGSGGIVTTPIGAADDVANAVLVQPDGKIVVAGQADTGGQTDFALLRYLPNGTLDLTFGPGGTGIVTTPIGSSNEGATALLRQPDGKLVAAGYFRSPFDNDFALIRYTPAGALDTTFGTGGKVGIDVGGTTDDSATAVALQSDGKLVVAGFAATPTGNDFALLRFSAAGVLDASFGVGGRVAQDLGGDDICTSLLIQPDGKIVAAGYRTTAGQSDIALVRFLTTGALDPSFGTGGILVVPIAGNDTGRAIVLQPDGKIVIAGSTDGAVNRDFAVIRVTTAGVLDPTFGFGGKVRAAFAAGQDTARAVALQADGMIVAAGDTFDGAVDRIALARFRGDPSSSPGAVCGNGVVELGEQCDDGNVASGDCCSALCQIETVGTVCRPAASTCDTPEVCNGVSPSCPADTGFPDADGDGVCDADDACSNVGGAQNFATNPPSKLVLSQIGADTAPGNDGLVLRADFVLPVGSQFQTLNPLANGARVVLRTSSGATRTDAVLPGGSYLGGGSRGWKSTPNKWTYIDSTGAPIGGIAKIILLDRSKKTPREVKLFVMGKKGTYAVVPGDQPVKIGVTVGGAAQALAGLCGESNYGPSSCGFDDSTKHLVCRR